MMVKFVDNWSYLGKNYWTLDNEPETKSVFENIEMPRIDTDFMYLDFFFFVFKKQINNTLRNNHFNGTC
jgi:hypothetical protein